MLTQMVQTYFARPNRLADLAEVLLDYENRVVSYGYVGRRKRSSYMDTQRNCVVITGILQYDTADEDLAANPDPHLADLRAAIHRLSDRGPIVEKYEAPGGRSEKYCEHSRWKEVVVICDPIQGLSPIRCNDCGGLIAKYRMNLEGDIADQLWTWERQYDRIYTLWLQSAEYEAWAERELASLDSPINQSGLGIARRMTETLQLQAYYYLQLKDEGLDRQCPDCKTPMHESIGTIWNLGCRQCCLVVGRG